MRVPDERRTPPAERVRVSSRNVLRLGFATVIAILVFSTVEAYRIQGTISQRHVVVYRQYLGQDEAVAQLRRDVWLAGNYVRDFFLSTSPERSVLLKSQIANLKAQSGLELARLEQMNADGEATRLFKANLRDYWNKLEPLHESMKGVRAPAAYTFVQEEIVTRRTALSNSLRRITSAGQASLQDSERQFVEKRQDAVRRLLFLLTLCVVLALLVSGFTLRYADGLERQTVRRYEEVNQAKREMEQLSARLLEIEEDGRRRLSRELHDEIGQALAILQIEVSHAQLLTQGGEIQLRERLARARNLAEKTVQTVRHMSLLLRPALLDDLGLVPALQWLLEDFQRRSGVSSDFSEEGVQDLLPDSVRTCVYRVVQEALHNCEKHAEASQVRVAVRQSTNLFRVDIEDNGRGLELNAKRMPRRNAGLGILGMRERAARVGGVLALESSPGYGTQISLQVPLAPISSDFTSAVTASEEEFHRNVYPNPVSG